MKKIGGVIPPIITPLLDNEDIDEPSLRNIVNRCVESGIHAIFVAGSGGETMALTQRQRNRAIQIAIDEARGRVPVLCGAMDTSTRKVIDNIRHIEQCGGDAAVVTPVFYTRTNDQNDIVKHFEEIAAHTTMPVIAYNIPKNTHVDIWPDTVARLANIGNIIGLKESSGSWPQFQRVLFQCRSYPEFALYQGNTEAAAISLACGADGYVPLYSIFFPNIFVRLYEEGKRGDLRSALFYQQIANYISDRLTVRGNQIIGAKAVAGVFGFGSPRLCGPYIPLSPEDCERLRSFAAQFDNKIRQLDRVDVADGMRHLLDFDDRAAAGL